MVGVSASVNLPLHHKMQKFSSGTDSPRWSRKKSLKTVVVMVVVVGSDGPKESRVRWRSRYPMGRANFKGKRGGPL